MKLNGIKQGSPAWIELMTTDPGAAVAFYGDLLGWEAEAAPLPDGDTYYIAGLHGDGVAGIAALGAAERTQGVPAHWRIYLATDDVDATVARVEAAGGTVVAPPFDVMTFGRMAVIQDPTGGIVSLWQARDHLGFGVFQEPGAVSWCELITDNPARAAGFLSTVLEVPTATMPMGDEAPYTLLGPEGEQAAGIMQKTPMMGDMPNVWGVYFEVADADATVARARERGATVLVEPQDIMPGRFAMIADPQGAVFGVIRSNPPA